ncbi:hypothetical protein CEXT_406951 [Caerostris extrusa]|uniref:Uncharacterized protein n=1 Tax=Caerostris extrusa TaxID=172846 RepID=A0AAV4XYT2_CAEEX|nr:hypothetical protein CEXT_406951 [Caerostris extrusa]
MHQGFPFSGLNWFSILRRPSALNEESGLSRWGFVKNACRLWSIWTVSLHPFCESERGLLKGGGETFLFRGRNVVCGFSETRKAFE